jgi:4a-hydroxytetrahydrobiopterin dehydratase
VRFRFCPKSRYTRKSNIRISNRAEAMTTLASEHCVACQKGDPRVTPDEAELLLPQIPEWTLVEAESGDRLERTYRFGNFMEALAFTKRVGRLAERAQHHPAICTEWGRASVTWTTHNIHGLHRNDFIMAARTDRLFKLQDTAARD